MLQGRTKSYLLNIITESRNIFILSDILLTDLFLELVKNKHLERLLRYGNCNELIMVTSIENYMGVW